MADLYFNDIMDCGHPLYEHLSNLPLFNIFTSIANPHMTMGCEQERLKCDNGIIFYHNRFTGSLISDLLISRGRSLQSVLEMMAHGYADAMNVPIMIRLFRSISS